LVLNGQQFRWVQCTVSMRKRSEGSRCNDVPSVETFQENTEIATYARWQCAESMAINPSETDKCQTSELTTSRVISPRRYIKALARLSISLLLINSSLIIFHSLEQRSTNKRYRQILGYSSKWSLSPPLPSPPQAPQQSSFIKPNRLDENQLFVDPC
jgi:hypothetical protein